MGYKTQIFSTGGDKDRGIISKDKKVRKLAQMSKGKQREPKARTSRKALKSKVKSKHGYKKSISSLLSGQEVCTRLSTSVRCQHLHRARTMTRDKVKGAHRDHFSSS